MSQKGKMRELILWLDDRFGISAITGFLREKVVPQHKHSIWYYSLLLTDRMLNYTRVMLHLLVKERTRLVLLH